MAKKTVKKKPGKQQELIDATPANAKKLVKVLEEYEEVKNERCRLSAEEVSLKSQVLEMVHEAKLQPIDSKGTVRFTLDGATVTVTPQKEKINIKFSGGDSDE